MRIVIIGAGEVGYSLARQLSYEKHDVSIIERDYARLQRAAETLDVRAIEGNGTSYRILRDAGITSADLLVAATTNDEVNIVASLIAKRYDVQKTIARVKNIEFLDKNAPLNSSSLNIDIFIHPESETANAAIRLLKQTAATDVIEFEGGRLNIVGIKLAANSPNLYTTLYDLHQKYKNIIYRIVAILRKDMTRIPTGQDKLVANDRIFVAAAKDSMPDVLRIFGKENERIDNIMILGGGQIGMLMAQELEKDHNVKLIESNVAKTKVLAAKLFKTLVIEGDGTDLNLLAQEGIVDMDAFIALTGDDETNIISCLMAKHLHVQRIISLANKTDYMPILPTIGIDAYLSKQMLTVNSILKYIRQGEIISVASVPGIAAEAIELIPKNGAKITRKPLYKLKFPSNAILGGVIRGDEAFIPVGQSQIQAGDKVVVFALPSAIRDVEKMFS